MQFPKEGSYVLDGKDESYSPKRGRGETAYLDQRDAKMMEGEALEE